MMTKWLRYVFFILLVKPIVFLFVGVNVRHRDRLPKQGPAIIIANHASYLDTIILMNLFPLRSLRRLRPVQIDSVSNTSLLSAIMVVNPLTDPDAFKAASLALGNKEVLIFNPEGARGDAQRLAQFKAVVAHFASQHRYVDIYPVFIHGVGKAERRAEARFVPPLVDMQVGKPIRWAGDNATFIATLEGIFSHLQFYTYPGDEVAL